MTPRLRILVVTFAAVAGVALTARLGMWQLSRAAQKVAAAAAVEAQGALPALTQAALSSDAAQVNRHVTLRGRWQHEKTLFLDNRPMNGRVGFFVLTPLLLEGRSEAVLVQRGWAPRNAKDRTLLPSVNSPTDAVTIDGRLASSPSQLFELGATSTGPIRQNLSVSALSAELHMRLLPFTVLQTNVASDGLLRDWAPADLGLQKHYGYAFQWFALAALILGLYVWFQLVKPLFARPDRLSRPA